MSAGESDADEFVVVGVAGGARFRILSSGLYEITLFGGAEAEGRTSNEGVDSLERGGQFLCGYCDGGGCGDGGKEEED